MSAGQYYIRLHDWHESLRLTNEGVACQVGHVDTNGQLGGTTFCRVNLNGRSPFGKACPRGVVLACSYCKGIEALHDRVASSSWERVNFQMGLHTRNDSSVLEGSWEQFFVARFAFLKQCFDIKNSTTQILFDAIGIQQHGPVGNAILFGINNPHRLETATQRTGTFVTGRDSFASGGYPACRFGQFRQSRLGQVGIEFGG
mmetsp:Transcript_51836/g.60571  ORF Transcript_51836/g.60571 Transcript_51836/m.60571 type:complete len:201 (-) Transcript_51836:185-787(-)